MLQQWPGPTSRGRGGSIHELPCSALTIPTVHVIGLRYVDPKRRWSEHKPPILEEFANSKATNNFHVVQLATY